MTLQCCSTFGRWAVCARQQSMGREFCKLKTGSKKVTEADSARADSPRILTFLSWRSMPVEMVWRCGECVILTLFWNDGRISLKKIKWKSPMILWSNKCESSSKAKLPALQAESGKWNMERMLSLWASNQIAVKKVCCLPIGCSQQQHSFGVPFATLC